MLYFAPDVYFCPTPLRQCPQRAAVLTLRDDLALEVRGDVGEVQPAASAFADELGEAYLPLGALLVVKEIGVHRSVDLR